MSRILILVLGMVLIVACDTEPTTDNTPPSDTKKPTAEPVAPTTGISKIQSQHDDLRKEIVKVEKQLDEGKQPPIRIVDQQIQIVDNLIAVTEMAMKIQATENLKLSHAHMRRQESKLHKQRTDLHTKMREIRETLAAAKTGEKLPEGFTETELQDQMSDHAKLDKKLAKEQEELRIEMGKKEALLAAGAEGPAQEESLFSRELTALKETKKQVEAVRARLN